LGLIGSSNQRLTPIKKYMYLWEVTKGSERGIAELTRSTHTSVFIIKGKNRLIMKKRTSKEKKRKTGSDPYQLPNKRQWDCPSRGGGQCTSQEGYALCASRIWPRSHNPGGVKTFVTVTKYYFNRKKRNRVERIIARQTSRKGEKGNAVKFAQK